VPVLNPAMRAARSFATAGEVNHSNQIVKEHKREKMFRIMNELKYLDSTRTISILVSTNQHQHTCPN
jgi:hypothetical protein